MRPKTCRLVAALLVSLLLPASAAADLPCTDIAQCMLRLTEGAETPRGLVLPPGFYLTPETWKRLDDEFKRLQDAETRLTAERDSLAESAKPPWLWIGAALVVGITTGLGVRLALD